MENVEILNDTYWNEKWKKAPIIYNGRTLQNKFDQIGVDVKVFIQPNDELLQLIITKYNLKKQTFDDTALAIQQFVVGMLTYKYDSDTEKVPDFWQFPFESIYSKVGDCEDGAILIAALCINAGIPEYRVKVAAGCVQPEINAPQGGHGYCIYLADDSEWRILDWCYYQDSTIPVNQKPLAKNGGYKNTYKTIWFTFNSQHSWNQESIVLGNRIANNSSKNTSSLYESFINNYNNLDYI